jgi:hypothetical protein
MKHVAVRIVGADGYETGYLFLLPGQVTGKDGVLAPGEENPQFHPGQRGSGRIKKML